MVITGELQEHQRLSVFVLKRLGSIDKLNREPGPVRPDPQRDHQVGVTGDAATLGRGHGAGLVAGKAHPDRGGAGGACLDFRKGSSGDAPFF